MGYNSHYWTHKAELSGRAKQHIIQMEGLYSSEIMHSYLNNRIYGIYGQSCPRSHHSVETKQIVLQKNTVEALFITEGYLNVSKHKTAILNFASFKNPGGMFLQGSSAQEESLCHSSTLYNVLSKLDENYYDYNRRNLNRGLYLDRLLYLHEIIFIKGEKRTSCDVITCAAPNFKAFSRSYDSSKEPFYDLIEENIKCLKSRAELIRDSAEIEEVDTLILGAWGCGVFGQDPKQVAEVFNEVFKKSGIQRVIYAVPDMKYNIFKEIITED